MIALADSGSAAATVSACAANAPMLMVAPPRQISARVASPASQGRHAASDALAGDAVDMAVQPRPLTD